MKITILNPSRFLNRIEFHKQLTHLRVQVRQEMIVVQSASCASVEFTTQSLFSEYFFYPTEDQFLIHETGEFICDADKWESILRASFTDINLYSVMDGDLCYLRADIGSMKIHVPTYPNMPEDLFYKELDASSENLTIDHGSILSALDMTSRCMGEKDLRNYLNGILCEFRKTSDTSYEMLLMGTDGYQLAIAKSKRDMSHNITQEVKIFLTSAIISRLKIVLKKMLAFAKVSSWTIHLKCIQIQRYDDQGRIADSVVFPISELPQINYLMILPGSPGPIVSVDYKNFTDNLKSWITACKAETIKINITDSSMSLFAEDGSSCVFEAVSDVEVSMQVSARHLLEATRYLFSYIEVHQRYLIFNTSLAESSTSPDMQRLYLFSRIA